MSETEQWDAIYKAAGALKLQHGTSPLATGIRGRFISVLIDKVIDFWGRHQDTLIPYLSQIAIAALEALVVNQAAYRNLNSPGPR